MTLFLSRGRTVAIYPGYKVGNLENLVPPGFTGRVRIAGPGKITELEIDYVRGRPACAVAVDSVGNMAFGDDALKRVSDIMPVKEEYVVEIIKLTEEEVELDCSLYPESRIKSIGAESPPPAPAEVGARELARTPRRAGNAEVTPSRSEEAIVFSPLDIVEAVEVVMRSTYRATVSGKAQEVLSSLPLREAYLICTTEGGEEVRILVRGDEVKATKPKLRKDERLTCKVFQITGPG